jgi:DNA-binding response OmpR family regulator
LAFLGREWRPDQVCVLAARARQRQTTEAHQRGGRTKPHPLVVVVFNSGRPFLSEPHGLALARMIKNKKPHVPIILMTAHPELLNKEVALPGAALCKPLEIAELCRAIKVRQTQ